MMDGIWQIPTTLAKTPRFLKITSDHERYYCCEGKRVISKRGLGKKFFETENEALAYIAERDAPKIAKKKAWLIHCAAPDLLAALEFVVKNTAADLNHSEADKIIAIAQAAIDKALTGESK